MKLFVQRLNARSGIHSVADDGVVKPFCRAKIANRRYSPIDSLADSILIVPSYRCEKNPLCYVTGSNPWCWKVEKFPSRIFSVNTFSTRTNQGGCIYARILCPHPLERYLPSNCSGSRHQRSEQAQVKLETIQILAKQSKQDWRIRCQEGPNQALRFDPASIR